MGNCVHCVNSLNCVNRGARLVPSQADAQQGHTSAQQQQQHQHAKKHEHKAQEQQHKRQEQVQQHQKQQQQQQPQQKPQPQPQQHSPAQEPAGRKKSAIIVPTSKPKGSNVLGLPLKDVKVAYGMGKELGRGQFGVTYSCTDKVTGEHLACKTISKRTMRSKLDMEDVQREMQIMQRLSGNPNIVELKAVYEDKQAVHFVMELCAGGELFDRIVSRGHYSEKAASNVFRSIITVVKNCHDAGVIHRDLKPENFLLTDKSENAVVKATDFGLSVFFTPGDKYDETVGSAYYVAPEVLRKSYGAEADVWSAGVILYILLSGLPPFWGESEKEIFRAILRGEIDFEADPWPSMSAGVKNLIRQMLKQNPSDRPSAEAILENSWVRKDGDAPDHKLHESILTRMKGFSAMHKLKKTALKIIAESLSEKEIKALRDLFKKMDKDNSGTITFEELQAGLTTQGYNMAESEVRRLLQTADVDDNGTIDYLEFISTSMQMNKMDRDNHLFSAFKQFDSDNSGFISIEELEQALYRYGTVDEDMIKDIVKEVDVNKDGRIDYNEFAAMMMKLESADEPPPKRIGMAVGKPKSQKIH